ncbi:MAG: hypothetical protein M0C28_13630 [Candidatus Moduliflexus flocculans]|nr:hypothetical protein [Candidatus Moduliflexus flocculans]
MNKFSTRILDSAINPKVVGVLLALALIIALTVARILVTGGSPKLNSKDWLAVGFVTVVVCGRRGCCQSSARFFRAEKTTT